MGELIIITVINTLLLISNIIFWRLPLKERDAILDYLRKHFDITTAIILLKEFKAVLKKSE